MSTPTTQEAEITRTAQYKLQVAERLPSNVGVKLLNKLPERIRNEASKTLFKVKLKHYLLQHAFYTVGEFMDRMKAGPG